MILIFLVTFSFCCCSWFWSFWWLWYPSTTLSFYFEVGCDLHIPCPFHDCDIHLIGHSPFTTCCDPHLLDHVVCLLQVEIFIFFITLSICYKLWSSSSWSRYLFATSHDLHLLLFLIMVFILLFMILIIFMVLILIFLCFYSWSSYSWLWSWFFCDFGFHFLLFMVVTFIFLVMIFIFFVIVIFIFLVHCFDVINHDLHIPHMVSFCS